MSGRRDASTSSSDRSLRTSTTIAKWPRSNVIVESSRLHPRPRQYRRHVGDDARPVIPEHGHRQQPGCVHARQRSRAPTVSEAAEDGVEHRLGELAGEGVLLADVVARHEPDLPADLGEEHRLAPCANRGFGRGTVQPTRRADARVASHAMLPRASIARSRGAARARSRSSQAPQVSRSRGVGLFAGGAQRTEATIRSPVRTRPSPLATLVGWLAYPVRCRAA